MPTPFRVSRRVRIVSPLAVPPCPLRRQAADHRAPLRLQIRSAAVISYAPPGSRFSSSGQ